jgi:uncharacterized membrane protein
MTHSPWLLRGDVLIAVLGMGLVTFLCRIGGHILRQAFRLPPFVETMLRELPGPLFVAYVAPALWMQGPTGLGGAALAVLVQWRTRQLAFSIPAGVLGVALAREAAALVEQGAAFGASFLAS